MATIYIFISFLYSLFFPSVKIVYFCSFFGEYSDNPKYIYEKLKVLYPDIRIAWTVNKKNIGHFPEAVKKIIFQSFTHYFYVYNAAVIVDNNMGLRQYPGPKNIFAKTIFGILSRRTSKQFNISTWHGTPYKCIGKDSIDFPKEYIFYHNTDYTTVGCTFTYNKFESAFGKELKIQKYGTPRNDIFFEKKNVGAMKEKLQLPLNKKIVLFAPTFRNDPSLNGICQLRSIQPEMLLEGFKSKFNKDWVIVCRFHNHVLNQIDVSKLYTDTILNGNIENDMQEYLLCSDALITDFSSSIFDFALTKKPCFLFASDIEQYSTTERGLYMKASDLPFPTSHTSSELLNEISTFDSEYYSHKLDSFLMKIGDYETGRASELISRDIATFFHESKKIIINE